MTEPRSATSITGALGPLMLAVLAACDGPRTAHPPTDAASSMPGAASALPTASVPAATSSSPPVPADAVRVHGPITGRISLRSARVVVGEPVVATVEVLAVDGPLRVYVGGDQRNAAYYPTRVAMRVLDEHDAVVCDTVAQPVIASFGGPGGEMTVAAGESFRESLVLNPMCPALANPGDYRLILHRRITHAAMSIPGPTGTPISCDMFPVHEGAMPPGLDARCVAMMDAVPSVTSELRLRVEPFDAAALRAATAARLSDAAGAAPVDGVGRERIHAWVCGWVTCGCATGPRPREDGDVIGALATSLPPGFPRACGSTGRP